jgi:hypothetical protein
MISRLITLALAVGLVSGCESEASKIARVEQKASEFLGKMGALEYRVSCDSPGLLEPAFCDVMVSGRPGRLICSFDSCHWWGKVP